MAYKIISVSISLEAWERIKDMPNRSKYINSLIERDLGIERPDKPPTREEVIRIIKQYLAQNAVYLQTQSTAAPSGEDITAKALAELDKLMQLGDF